jgi:hypothetical protein
MPDRREQLEPRHRRFDGLRLELLRGGVAPGYVKRTILELEEHCEDLERDALAAGLSAEAAARAALARLGNEESIVAAVLARTELRVWSYRWPRAAWCLRSAATVISIPGRPVIYCIDRSGEIARWATALGTATLLVGTLLACLNWMIVLT